MKKIYLLLFFIYCFSSHAQPWQALANVPLDLSFPVVVELNGNIHVLGGGAASGASNLHLRYTPSTDTWDTLAPVPYLAQQPAGAVVNGKIHICGGGYPTTGQRLDSHYYYDPDSAQWYQAANMPVATAIHKAVSLDGKMYVFSGQPNRYLSEYYDPVSNSWTQLNALPDMNFWYGAIVATSQTIYRFGGGGYGAPVNLAHQYDKVSDTWIPLPVIPASNHAPAGTAINDSLIMVSGGYSNFMTLDEVWIFNTNAQTYSPSDSLPAARNYHSMVKVDSCVYSVGGYNPAISTVGISLLKNCTLQIIASVPLLQNQSQKPYSLAVTSTGFSLHMNDAGEKVSIILTDINGRGILFKGIENGSAEISNENLNDGIYIVMINTGEHFYSERWIVSR